MTCLTIRCLTALSFEKKWSEIQSLKSTFCMYCGTVCVSVKERERGGHNAAQERKLNHEL